MSAPNTKTQPLETVTVDTAKLYCDGGAGALGHPRVYLTMTAQGSVDCPYCGKHFVLAAGAKHGADH